MLLTRSGGPSARRFLKLFGHMQKRKPMNVLEIQREYAGHWVAVKEGAVVEARDNPHRLVMALRERHIEGASIFRCPATHEPELVGLG